MSGFLFKKVGAVNYKLKQNISLKKFFRSKIKQQRFRISRSNDYANAHHHGNARDDRAHDAQQNLLRDVDEVIHHGNVRDD